MSWQRIYRPKTIQGLHLTNVRETLQQLMDKGQIPQVLLFAGPKGTGKTSLARIIGAMLNDPANEKVVDYQFFNGSKPKNNKYVEPDFELNFNDRIYRGKSFIVQEMDAASNRGIDDIRELKERVALPPQDGKMTVYILDEAHMLTSAAFNALLKLLEEPPVHAVFILATTEFHKIPETIKSRCSVIHFRKADHEELKQALRGVLEAEKISFQE
ncbi:AAA family ATPase, partial [Patescibacteria group bacterium]|nr:AAA family ATPase [Patescibacteria group bacterium]MBU1966832.1 AAA family ATPase [Patescibacteria group bacterium]